MEERIKAAVEYINGHQCDLTDNAAFDAVKTLSANWHDAVWDVPIERLIKADLSETLGKIIINVAIIKAFTDGWTPDGSGLPPVESLNFVKEQLNRLGEFLKVSEP